MDINSLMSQARKMQENVAVAQKALSETVSRGGGGLAIVEMSGKYDLLRLILDPELMKETAEDAAAIISAAFKDAKAKCDAEIERVMGAATTEMIL
ncbi:MAG: YbaB/EbfC family nucleoid-associated protein [Rickettsiales bacterium]|jgi:DNA-binding protein YbaB|nr:YbaB/EbfC family nucleoid-associated protein [Rickettsiales bacterium]